MISVVLTARAADIDPTPAVAALRQQAPDAELLLAGPMQQTDATLPLFFDHNPTRARNRAIEASSGHIICLLDAQCVPVDGWVEALCDALHTPATVGVKGVYVNRRSALIARFVQCEYESKYARLRSFSQIDFVDTYSAAYRRDVLCDNGGFDDRFHFLEDQELSFRLAARGYRLAFAPAARVIADHPQTLGDYARHKFRVGFWKAQVVRRFPGQGIADSHTPQIVKLQMALIVLLLPALLLSFWQPLLAPLLLLIFGVTTLPFLQQAWQQDRAVSLIAPPLLFTRAAALGGGYLWGTLRPQPSIANERTTIGGVNYIFKRLLDICGGLAGCLLCLLALPAIAVAIKLSSSGPIFFRQERVGERGRPFTIIKFRTMVADAEQQLPHLIDIGSLHEPAFKIEADPRVTAAGRVLRRWSLDELPQFWNVLKGEMSLVGPRPEETQIVQLYNSYQRRRLAVKPGMSGPMQVFGRGDLPLSERVRLEIEYIENYSVGRDLRILLRTIPAVISGRGAR